MGAMRRWQTVTLCVAVLGTIWTGRLQATGTMPLTVTATVLSQSNCRFQTSTATLSFGTIDSGGILNASASSAVTFKCTGSAPSAAFFISHDNGLHASVVGTRRMQHTTLPTVFLPYQISASPQTGTVPKNVDQTVTLTGTVLATDYQSARAGSYADTVVLTISP